MIAGAGRRRRGMESLAGGRTRLLAGVGLAAAILHALGLPGNADPERSPQDSNVARGKPVTADSVYHPGYPPAHAVDGDRESVSSRWLSARTNDLDWSKNPHWIEIDLQGTFRISELRFWTGAQNEYKWPPADFRFQRWHDGAWVDVFTETGNESAAYSKHFPPVAASRVRLYATRGTDPGALRLYEIEVYGR
jgi:hypothetical protein